MTQYALVTEDSVEEAPLPASARKLVDGQPIGEWVLGLDDTRTSDDVRAKCGYFPIEEDEKPPCKSNQYLEAQLVNRYGLPVREWKRRIKPLEQQVEETNTKKAVDGFAQAKAALESVLASVDEPDQITLEGLQAQVRGLAKTVELLAKLVEAKV